MNIFSFTAAAALISVVYEVYISDDELPGILKMTLLVDNVVSTDFHMAIRRSLFEQPRARVACYSWFVASQSFNLTIIYYCK